MVRAVKLKLDKYAVCMMICLGAFFYFLPGQWISLEDDSIAYLEVGGEGVLPGYPIFLSLFRRVLGEQYFLNGVVTAQSILAILCTLLFVIMLRNQFKLQGWECILLYAACMLPFSIYLPESGITHQIMTEGITYSLFYLYFLFLLKFIMDRKYYWGVALIIMSLILMFIRSQLILLLLSSSAAFVCVVIRKLCVRENAKKLIAIFVGMLVVACGTFIVLFGKKLLEIPQFTSVLMIRGFYEADYEDKELFDTPEMQEIFERVYKAVDEKEYRYVYARQDLYMWQDLVCDRIASIAHVEITDYLEAYPESDISNTVVVRELGSTILLKHFDRYLYHTLRLMMPGFIAAVFWQIKPIYLLCHFIALCLYLYAVGGSVICLRRKKKCPAAEFMMTVVGFILIMIISVNVMFIGLQRYVVYAMGIFYCAAYLLFKELVMNCFAKRGSWKE